MDIQLYAAILLIIRIITMVLMGFVLKRQLELFKLPIDKEITLYRKILFALALLIFLGNIIPAAIDLLTLTGDIIRSTRTVNGASLTYTLAWACTSLLSSVLIFWLYRMSHNVDQTHTESEHTLMNDEHTK